LARFQLAAAIVFGLATGVVWFAFLRPIPTRSAVGTIVRKTFQPEATYWQFHSGANRGFRTPNAITLAEAYVFEVTVEGWDSLVRHALNTKASEGFREGDRVQIRYQRRGLPPLWSRIYIFEMTATGER
jgi:hypothetical protein